MGRARAAGRRDGRDAVAERALRAAAGRRVVGHGHRPLANAVAPGTAGGPAARPAVCRAGCRRIAAAIARLESDLRHLVRGLSDQPADSLVGLALGRGALVVAQRPVRDVSDLVCRRLRIAAAVASGPAGHPGGADGPGRHGLSQRRGPGLVGRRRVWRTPLRRDAAVAGAGNRAGAGAIGRVGRRSTPGSWWGLQDSAS